MTSRHRAFLALGSNIGDRVGHLRRALALIPDVDAQSAVYETPPISEIEQDAFLNMVVRLDTELDAHELLDACRVCEADAQRVRIEHWGPRTLDVDVLWVDGETVDDPPDLVVPHPRMFERSFVLVPLADVGADIVPAGYDVAAAAAADEIARVGMLADLEDEATALKVHIVGGGRAGGALALALTQAGWPEPRVIGRHDDLATVGEGADLVVIATPDRAIADVAARLPRRPEVAVAHVAGSFGLDVLGDHPRVAALHPLVSLADPQTGAARLVGAWFAVAGDPAVQHVVAALDGHAFHVADEDRAAYHAAAVVASNHLVALLGQAERIADTAGVPLGAFLDLVRGSVENVADLGPAAALTGPAARGDEDTIARHVAALAPGERAAYEALAGEARRLAGRPRPGMRTFDTIAALRTQLDADRAAGLAVGFVPTMGYLHDGHVSLIDAAVAANDRTVVSIFVNPLQFAEGEDLEDYPRDLDADRARCETAGADYIFAPPVEEMYPRPVDTVVTVPGVAAPLEGEHRPTHFAGVATVCAKLFAIIGPGRAYFGAKDWQQVAVVTRMVSDLSIPVEVVPCPIVREADGLAMSSRNVYLSDAERAQAPALRHAIDAGLAAIDAGEREPAAVTQAMRDVLAREAPLGAVDYAAAVPADTLVADGALSGDVRLLVAMKFSKARLIDNDGVRVD